MNAEDRDTAILQLQPIVWAIVRQLGSRFGLSRDEQQDAAQEALVGAIEAVDRFDSSSGFKLATYARYRIRGAVLDYIRRLRGRTDARTMLSLDVASDGDQRERDTWSDNTPDPAMLIEQRIAEEELAARMWAHVRRLPQPMRMVILLRFRYGWTGRQIAAHLGVHQTRASQILIRGLKYLRRACRHGV